MKRFALGSFGVLLLIGCADLAKEMEMVNDKLPAANATVATETPAAESVADGAADAASPIDAERLLASTLQNAKAANKRVMVHLGAPW